METRVDLAALKQRFKQDLSVVLDDFAQKWFDELAGRLEEEENQRIASFERFVILFIWLVI